MNAVRLGAAAAARFPATAHARQQISRAFLDGIMGYALVGKSGWAIVVGDFVELGGEPDAAVLSALTGGDDLRMPLLIAETVATSEVRKLSDYRLTRRG